MVHKSLLTPPLLALLLAASYLTVHAPAAPPKAPVTLPNIAYDITLLPINSPNVESFGMNNALQVVGQTYTIQNVDSAGFLYDHSTATVWTLGDLISELDMQSLLDAGFTQSKFRGINDWGVIVGYVGNADFSAADGIMIDTVTGRLTRTSSFVTFFNPYLLHINNWGDMVGGYHVGTDFGYTFTASYDSNTASYAIRDFGRAFPNTLYSSNITDSRLAMLGKSTYEKWSYDFTSDSLTQLSTETSGLTLWQMDQQGRCVGWRNSTSSRGSKTYPIAFDPQSGKIIWQSSLQGWAYCVNDPSATDPASVTIGDILFYDHASSKRSPLYLRNPVYGEVNLDSLISPTDPYRKTWLESRVGASIMTQKRDDTNFGAIAGHIGNKPCLLVPKPFAR